jgi:natural product precursor
MKSKVFTKKLVLNKKTIVDLNKKEMKDVVGGEPGTRHCPSYSDWPLMCPFTYCPC